MVGARPLAVLDLGLGDGRAVVDVPDRRRLGAVGLAAGEVAEERLLARAPADVVDRLVLQRPVVGQPEAAEEVLEDRLVGGRQLVAELDEVRPRDRDLVVVLRRVTAERRLEARVVRLRRVAAHAVVVLHPPLGGQAVVVPADREEHRLAGHPPLAGDGVGLRVAEHGAHVDRAGDRRRRRVDGEDVGALGRAVEAVDAVGLPARRPARLDAVQRRLLRDLGHRIQDTGSGCEPPWKPSASRWRHTFTVGADAAPVRHRHEGGTRARPARARQGVDLPVRPHGVRPAAPRSRAPERWSTTCSCATCAGRASTSGWSPTSPTSTTRSSTGPNAEGRALAGHPERSARPCGGRRPGPPRRRPARRHAARHRVRRRDGRDDRPARRDRPGLHHRRRRLPVGGDRRGLRPARPPVARRHARRRRRA